MPAPQKNTTVRQPRQGICTPTTDSRVEEAGLSRRELFCTELVESSWDILASEEKNLRSNFERRADRPAREIALSDEEVRYTSGQRGQPKRVISENILDGFRTVSAFDIGRDEADG
jgi:hypothetical protein